MVKRSALDETAQAIASAPRRAIMECLADGDASMTDLADALGITLPAIDKHLQVLLRAGIVSKSKSGRTTRLQLVPGSLDGLGAWAMSTRLMWGNALDRLHDHLTEEQR